MNSNFGPAITRGISNHYLYELDQQQDYAGAFFHDDNMDGAYEDAVSWEGLGLPVEHLPLERANFDGIRPSYGVRYFARSWTLGVVIPLEDRQDDLYGIIHKMLPMAGGEFARSYYALQQILAAQFFGLYGFMSGTSVPFSPDGLSFFNTAHKMSLGNQATTWSNRPSVAADLSISTAQMAEASMQVQKRPNGLQFIPNKIKRVMVHPNERLVAKQIFGYGERERGTTDNNRNYLADEDVEVVSNPYWEYSGTNGLTNNAFNSWFAQGRTHYCRWKKRSDLQVFSRFDNSVFADIITCIKRFAYGLDDSRGLYGSPGL